MLQNILNAGGETLGEVVGRSEESANKNAFSRDFDTSNFDSFGGTVQHGKFIEIGRFRVPADTEYSWGYGTAKNPENQGYIYCDLYDDSTTPVEVEGTLRLLVESSTGRRQHVVQDLDTTRLDASRSDKAKMVPLPEQVGSPLASEDAYIVTKLNPVSSNDADTVSAANSDIIFPVTEYDLS